MATTFVHLTDTHIQPNADDRLFGLDTMQSLRDTLDLLCERGVLPGAAVVISGDLANNGEPESYARLREIVDGLRAEGSDVLLALGNHDHRANFRRVLLDEPDGDGTAKYHYTHMLGGLRLVVLDSHEIGTHAGALGAAQLDWLRGELATPAPDGTVIVVHHPPTRPPRSPSSQMLGDRDALRDVIAGTDVVGIVAGHTHVMAVEAVGAVPCISSPGTAFLLDVTVRDSFRFLDGGGVTLITVADGLMTATPLALPRSGREMHHHRSGEPTAHFAHAAAPAVATA